MDSNQTHSPARYEQRTFPNISDSDPLIIPLVSYTVYSYFNIIFGSFLTSALNVFGLFSNTANLIVYYKMGLQDTTTIDFFSLAISDFVVSASTFVLILSRWPIWDFETVRQMPFVASLFTYPACGFGAMITALLSTERCLCIVFPLKVKTIVTSKRLVALISIIATYQLCFLLLFFIRTGPPYDQYPPERHLYIQCSFTIPSFICFGIVLITSSFLIIRLKQSVKWRNATVANSARDSNKEKKIASSVVLICSMFIICFFPNLFNVVISAAYQEFYVFNPYLTWLVLIFYTFGFFFQSINSSANIFVYYSMSTRFREVFKETFVPEKSRN